MRYATEQTIKNKLRDKETMLFTLKPMHLGRSAFNLLCGDKITVYEITMDSIQIQYREMAQEAVWEGYSVVFKHEGKTKILQYR